MASSSVAPVRDPAGPYRRRGSKEIKKDYDRMTGMPGILGSPADPFHRDGLDTEPSPSFRSACPMWNPFRVSHGMQWSGPSGESAA